MDSEIYGDLLIYLSWKEQVTKYKFSDFLISENWMIVDLFARFLSDFLIVQLLFRDERESLVFIFIFKINPTHESLKFDFNLSIKN